MLKNLWLGGMFLAYKKNLKNDKLFFKNLLTNEKYVL